MDQLEDTDGCGDNPSFGINRILDVKVEGGQQMYKVEWMSTWEPAESLSTCQHLVDQFWSHVNKAKQQQHIAQQVKLSQNVKPDVSMYTLSDDCKINVQMLISRTNTNASLGSGLISPGAMLERISQEHAEIDQNFVNPSAVKSEKRVEHVAPKANNKQQNSSTASLKYIDNFSNPYVKIQLVCKSCNKEQSTKDSSKWKRHFMSHSDQKPFPCTLCDKSFTEPNKLRSHMQAKHKSVKLESPTAGPKTEVDWNY